MSESGVIGQMMQGVQEDVDGGPFLAGERVRRGPDHLAVRRFDAVVEEPAAGCLASREALDRLAHPRAGAEPEHDALRTSFPARERALEQPLILAKSLVGRVPGAAHVADDRGAQAGWEMERVIHDPYRRLWTMVQSQESTHEDR